MQGLIIAIIIVASAIFIISLYTFWVTYKINKLGKEDLSLSNEFCKVHLKQIWLSEFRRFLSANQFGIWRK